MKTSMLKTALVALTLSLATTTTGLTSAAQAQGQLSFDIQASKNTKEGKVLDIFNQVAASGALNGGKGNRTKVSQHGNKNCAGVKQHGKSNTAAVGQFGNHNCTNVAQNGNNNSQSVFQFGNGTSSNVTQNGDNQAGLHIDAGL